jgi:hypothetical protein
MAESISVEDAARACRVRAGTGQTESNERRDEGSRRRLSI